MKKGYILGAVAGLGLLAASEYVRTPLEFTDVSTGYTINQADGEYSATFENNASVVSSTGRKDSEGNEFECGSSYYVKGYENFWGRHAKTIEKIAVNP